FMWGVIPSAQIYPVYSNFLNKELQAVLRMYRDVDNEGKEWNIYELWNDTECAVYQRNGDIFEPREIFTMDFAGQTVPTNVFKHSFGRVPFIEFPNNNTLTSDLTKIKTLVDTYDKTFSGFVDDLEDVQQIIFVLTNYGGTDLKQFLNDMKYYKTISVESNGADDRSGVSTLSIDIPVEARDKLLELTRKAIFDMGQGIDPQQQGIERASGEAMKFLYSLLELKAGLLETEFRLGFGELVRAICSFHGKEIKQIIQTWTRTAIRNDAELVDMCQKSVGVISTKTILKNHPFVENAEDEEKELQEEKDAQMAEYDNAFTVKGFNQNDDDDEQKKKGVGDE
ncbi:MAG: phage portal protein, partial [Clostridia bacterium]|nr:phage portal protein [Clostridia bacterium]